MAIVKIVNLTGESITVSNATFPSEGKASVVPVQEITSIIQTEHGHFMLVRAGCVEGLPEYDGVTRYIVTREVADAAMANGRLGYDLLYPPSSPIRDEDGRCDYEVLTCAQWVR